MQKVRRANRITKRAFQESSAIAGCITALSIFGKTIKGAGQNLRRVRRCRSCNRKFWGQRQGWRGKETEEQSLARNLCPDCFFKTYQKKLPDYMRLLTPDEEIGLENYYKAQGCTVRSGSPARSPQARSAF